MNKRLHILLVMMLSLSLFAEKVTVSHRYYIGQNETLKEAEKKGLAETKEKALQKAGIAEDVSSQSALFSEDLNGKLTKIFQSDILVSIRGYVKEWKHRMPVQKGYDREKDLFYYDFNIDADVREYKTKPDATFQARIDNIEKHYTSGSPVKFNVTPSKNCFIKIFYISDSQASLFYPLRPKDSKDAIPVAENEMVKKNDTKSFDYLNANATKEIDGGRLIVVITKEDIPFVHAELDDKYYTKTKVSDIFKWLLQIEPDKRKSYYFQFSITKSKN